jgi:hypothetical protein
MCICQVAYQYEAAITLGIKPLMQAQANGIPPSIDALSYGSEVLGV